MHWVDKAIEELEMDYENGLLTDKELDDAMKDVYAEHQQEADDAAEEARANVLGYY